MDSLNKIQIHQRKQRGITQKLFLIETLKKKDEKSREYVIMGSTGNVYNVNITNDPTCTCPDYTNHANRCKHIFFVLVRIMKVIDPDKLILLRAFVNKQSIRDSETPLLI